MRKLVIVLCLVALLPLRLFAIEFESRFGGILNLDIEKCNNRTGEAQLVFYLKGLPRHTNKYDDEIIKDLLKKDFHVCVVDYKNNLKAVSPHINEDVLLLRKLAIELQDTIQFDIDRVFIIPQGYTIECNVNYYSDSNKTLAMDVWYPYNEASEVPLILQVSHNYSIRMSNMSSSKFTDALIEGLAIEGFAVAKVDYPNKDKELLPVTRINSAVRVIRHNAAKYNVDKNKIGAFGFSKGSSATAFLAFDNEPPTNKNGFYYEESDRIQAALLMASRFDLFQAYNDPKATKYATALEKNYGHPEGNSETYSKFSPISYLTEKAPPIFLSIGALDADRTEQVRILAAKLKELNVPFIYTEEPFDKHKVTTNPETVKAINNFFKDWLSLD
jgi:hypothetical protein